VRALEAAGLLEVRLLKKSVQRPLMSVWVGEDKNREKVFLTVVDACGTPAERDRVIGGANAMQKLAGTAGVQNVRRVLEDVDAFVSDFHGAGTAADLVVLRWPTLRKLDFVCRICDALVALHEAGVIHGCLCPDNVLLDDELRPFVTEAGMVSIAQSLEGDPENFFGYGAYASPETARGAPDARGDVFSVGRLLTFVMLDRTPGETVDVMDLNAKDSTMAAIVRRCTGPAANRYASMAELSAELQRCRQMLAPASEEMARRPPLEEAPARPARAPVAKGAAPASLASASGTAPSRTTSKATQAAPEMAAAPWWVGAASAAVLVGCVMLAQMASLRSQSLHLTLVTLVALAMMGLTTIVPATKELRLGLLVVGLAAAIVLDPIGRLSQLDSPDASERGAAARTFVIKGGKDLEGMHLQGADLSGLDLTGADLDNADMTGASFAKAKLDHAAVSRASLVQAHFEGASLGGVALEGSYGVETATCDESTVPPEGWMCGPRQTLKKGAPPPSTPGN
jgi:hypothetical protein